MPDTARFRIVVPTYRRAHHLRVFLEMLAPQLAVSPDFRLTVVNDGSDGPGYRAAVAPYLDRIDYIVLPTHQGTSAARLIGIERADEEYIVATDDDCRPPPLWLGWVRALTGARPHVDVFAGFTDLVTEPPRRPLRFWQELPDATPGSVIAGGHLLTAVGANAIYRRSFLQGVAPLPVSAPDPPDDYHLTQTALRRGASYLVAPELRTGHVSRRSLYALLRTQWFYGYAAAAYAVEHRDQTLLSRFVAAPWAALATGWREPGARLRVRAAKALLAWFWAIGWRRGLAQTARRVGADRAGLESLQPAYGDTALALPGDPDSSARAPSAATSSGSSGK